MAKVVANVQCHSCTCGVKDRISQIAHSLFPSALSQSISIHPWRLAVMTVLSSAITAGVNGILMLTLKPDYHIVEVD